MMSNALKFTNEGQISVKLSIDDIKPSSPKEDSTNDKELVTKGEKSEEGDRVEKDDNTNPLELQNTS